MNNNTLKYLFAVFLPLILGLLFVACKHGNPEVGASLDRIEQVVVLHPDSALIELVRLDSLLDAGAVSIEGDRQMARYALLKTQTNDKNYIDDTNDSLIIRAVRYYDEHGSKRERMLAHFYHAAIFRNARDYGAAFVAYRQAESLALYINEDYYLTRIYGNLFTISYDTYSKDAIMYARKNLEYARKSGDVREALLAKAEMAKTYSVRLVHDSAEYWFRQVIDSLPAADPIVQGCLTSYIELCMTSERYHLADSLFGLFNKPVSQSVDLMNKACLFQVKGMSDSADVYMQRAKDAIIEPGQTVFYYEKLSSISEMKGNLDSALAYKSKRLHAQNEVITSIFSKSVSDYQRDFEKQQKELAEYRYSQYRYISGLVACIVVLLLMAAFRYFYSSRKEQQQTINSYVEKASILEQVLMEQKEKISALQNKVEETSSELDNNIRRTDTDIKHAYAEFEHRIDLISAEQEDREKKHLEQVRQLYAKRFIELNDLCESFYRVQGKIDEQKQIYKKVRMLIDGFVEPSQQKKLDSIIDANFDDAMKKVKSAEIGLNEMELQLYRLKVSGFSTVAICLIMHYDNPPAIRKRIQRIRKTILQSESPYKEEVASLM